MLIHSYDRSKGLKVAEKFLADQSFILKGFSSNHFGDSMDRAVRALLLHCHAASAYILRISRLELFIFLSVLYSLITVASTS